VHFHAGSRLKADPWHQFLGSQSPPGGPFIQVLDTDTLYPLSEPTLPPAPSRLTAALCHVALAIRSLIASFPAIIGDGSGTPNPKHEIKHSKARRLDLDKLHNAKAEFRALEKAG
jgi:hypothetical protein